MPAVVTISTRITRDLCKQFIRTHNHSVIISDGMETYPPDACVLEGLEFTSKPDSAGNIVFTYRDIVETIQGWLNCGDYDAYFDVIADITQEGILTPVSTDWVWRLLDLTVKSESSWLNVLAMAIVIRMRNYVLNEYLGEDLDVPFGIDETRASALALETKFLPLAEILSKYATEVKAYFECPECGYDARKCTCYDDQFA